MGDTVPPSAKPSLVGENPFFHRGAVKDQEYFFGRDQETREILGAISRGQCVSIVGPWHIGKTSLLFHIKSSQVLRKYGLAPDKLVMVYCTGQGLRGNDQSNLCGYLLKKLYPYEAIERVSGAPVDLDRSRLLELLTTRLNLEELRTLCFTLGEGVKDLVYDDLPGEGLEARARELIAFLAQQDKLGLLLVELFEQRPDLADEEDDLFVLDGKSMSRGGSDLSLDIAYHDLYELAKRLTQKGLRIVLLLDEFELFATNPHTQESFFRNLQALQDEHALTIVTSSRISLDELSHLDGAHLPHRFFLMFLPLNLGLFSPEEAVSLITETSRRAGITFSERAVEFILDTAGLHPFFLQVACDCVFDRLSAKSQLDTSDYDNLRWEIGRQLKGMFGYYWDALNPEQQSALLDLGVGQASPGREQHLEELVQEGLVCRKGQVYDYVSTSFREFVQKYQSAPSVKLGTVRILEEVGSGRMGVVYKAFQSSLKRYVAVKVLSHDATREGFPQRFREEAQALASLRHPNILSIYDFGQGFGQEKDRVYIVMDYVPGGTLANLISEGLPLRRAIEIAMQIGDALHYAHQRGVVHRDVKPTNILIDTDGRPLLADFGLVKVFMASEPLTKPRVGMGTPAYMAPEQAWGEDVDARSDVYALGTVLYEMVTGRLPFEAEDGISVVLKKLQEPPPPPRQLNSSLPIAVEQVILKALAPLPKERYQSASEITEALRDVLGRVLGEVSPEDEEEWQLGKHLIEDSLLTTGNVNLDQLVGIAEPSRESVWRRYFYGHQSEYDLMVEASRAWVRNQNRLDALNQSWQEMVSSLVSHKSEQVQESVFDRCAAGIAGQLQASIGFPDSVPSALPSRSPFLTFSLDTKIAFEHTGLPSFIPLLFLRRPTLREDDVEALRHLLQVRMKPPCNVALLVVPSDVAHKEQIEDLLQRRLSVYSCDVVLLGLTELRRIMIALNPQSALRHLVLPKIDLISISPFVTKGPAPDSMFFGRERELREITDNAAMASYAVIGGRRIGKTSILGRLHRVHLPVAGFHTFRYHCQNLPETEPTRQQFLDAIAHEWLPNLTGRRSSSFADILARLPSGKLLVFLLDEADKLIPADWTAGWPLFGELRALAESGRCQFVFAGERTLREAVKSDKSPLFNFANVMLIGCLDFPAVQELIIHPMKQLEIDPTDEVAIVQRIWDFTSGHPNIVQQLCARLIIHLNERRDRRLTPDDVESVVADPTFQRDDFYDVYLEQATVLERILPLLLAQDGNEPYTLDNVCGLLHGRLNLIGPTGEKPRAAEVDAALRHLTDLRSVLNYTRKGYVFAVKSFPQVIARWGQVTVEDELIVLKEKYRDYGDLTESEIEQRGHDR